MIPPSDSSNLSRRENELLHLLYELREASPAELLERLPDDMHNSTVRTILYRLMDKGWISRRKHEGRYVYAPVDSTGSAGKKALQNLFRIFYGGRLAPGLLEAVEMGRDQLTEEEIRKLKAALDGRK